MFGIKKEAVMTHRYVARDATHSMVAEPVVHFVHRRSGGGFIGSERDLTEVGDGSLERGIERVRRRFSRLNPHQIMAAIRMRDMRWIYDMADED